MGTRDRVGVVTAVMHDTSDLEGAVAFWTELLGLDVVQRDDTYVYLSRFDEAGPRLAFQLVPEAKTVKNRLHLDVRVPNREAFEQLVVELGGSRLGESTSPGHPVWSIMADPQGNEFCIYERPD